MTTADGEHKSAPIMLANQPAAENRGRSALNLLIESVGVALWMAAIIATAVMGQRQLLSDGELHGAVAVATGVTFGALFILIRCLTRHDVVLNPILALREPVGLAALGLCHIAGACAGVIVVQFALNLDPVQGISQAWPTTAGRLASEMGASFVIVCVFAVLRTRGTVVTGFGLAVALSAMCWLSPDFATGHPAATFARALTAGPLAISLPEAGMITAAQIISGAAAYVALSVFARKGER
jgi:hypothetical protein